MSRLMLEVSGCRPLIADLLWQEAPDTCAAFYADLPYRSRTLGHVKWSGHVISLFTSLDFRRAECSRSLGVCPGDILYNPHLHDAPTHPNELSIVYGPAAMRTFSGYTMANLFARIRPEYLAELYLLGIDINRRGEQTITITAGGG